MKIFILILCLLLTGCAGWVSGDTIEKAQAICESHGGLAYAKFTWSGDHIVCVDGAEIIKLGE